MSQTQFFSDKNGPCVPMATPFLRLSRRQKYPDNYESFHVIEDEKTRIEKAQSLPAVNVGIQLNIANFDYLWCSSFCAE